MLITAWRTTRACVIAELVDAIDKTDPMPAFTGDYETWLAASEVATTHRGALLRAIPSRTPADLYSFPADDGCTRCAMGDTRRTPRNTQRVAPRRHCEGDDAA